MKSIIIIYFCVLLRTIDSNAGEEETLDDVLNGMAKENESINRIFIPSKDGLLVKNTLGHIYEGIFLPKNMTVAMKFITSENDGEKEYEMYTYLHAINHNQKVEALGIPAIYYYGTWEDYHIMAMTLLDREFYDDHDGKDFDQIDLLLLFREFVRITKYMHTNGVFHKKIEFIDIVFRKHQGFIYDFNDAESLPNGTPQDRQSAARIDWRGFLWSMYRFINYSRDRWSWLGFSDEDNSDERRMQNVTNFVFSLKNDSETNESHNFSGLRKVFVEFAKYAYCNDSTTTTPFYDQMYQVIVEELERYAQQQDRPAIPSWLSDDQDKLKAMSAINEIPKISKIREPFEWERIEYAEVNYELFPNRYREFHHDQPSSSEASGRPAPEKRFRNCFNCFKSPK